MIKYQVCSLLTVWVSMRLNCGARWEMRWLGRWGMHLFRNFQMEWTAWYRPIQAVTVTQSNLNMELAEACRIFSFPPGNSTRNTVQEQPQFWHLTHRSEYRVRSRYAALDSFRVPGRIEILISFAVHDSVRWLLRHNYAVLSRRAAQGERSTCVINRSIDADPRT